MNEYNEGDLVEAVKGDMTIRGRLGVDRYSNFVLQVTPAVISDTRHLEANGFTITIIEKAKPKIELPTAYGLYRLSNGMVVDFGNMGWRSPNWSRYMDDEVQNSESFTPLAPVAYTAQAVLDYIQPHIGYISHLHLSEKVAAEFGAAK